METRSIVAKEWVGKGILTRRDALPWEHEESWLSLWIRKYGNLDEFPFEQLNIEVCLCCNNPTKFKDLLKLKMFLRDEGFEYNG